MTLLVVDDNRIDRILLEKILLKYGFEATSSSNGDEALKIFASEAIDLALIDWMMPPTGGLSLCKKIREIEVETGNFCYIIMVTGKKLLEDEVRAFETGVNDFITKPFVETVLIARVKAGLRIIDDRRNLMSRLNTCLD